MRAQWEQVAADLGLNFRPGLDGFLDSPRIQEMFARSVVGGDSRKASEVLTNPLLRSLLAKVFTGFITGVRDGFEVFLIPGGNSSGGRSHSHVQVCLLFPRPYEYGLEIKPTGPFAWLGRLLASTGLVRVPGAEFEKRVVVRAKQPNQAAALLSDERLRERILELFRFSRNFKIDDLGIRFQEPGRIISADRARRILDLMATAAKSFY